MPHDSATGAARGGPTTATECVTCGSALQGAYCHVCGEKAIGPEDLRVSTFVRRAVGAAFDADSRLWRTLRLLMLRPGTLTAEFVRGRREPYVHPLQTFLLANLVFFLVLNTFGGFTTFTTRLEHHYGGAFYGPVARELVAQKAPAGSEAAADYARRFNEATPNYANTMVIVMMPVFAAFLALLFRKRPFVQHLVFSLHFMAFHLVVSVLLGLLFRGMVLISPRATALFNDVTITTLMLTIFSLYLVSAVHRAYGASRWRSLAGGVAAAVAIIPTLVVYRAVLFFAVYLTLG